MAVSASATLSPSPLRSGSKPSHAVEAVAQTQFWLRTKGLTASALPIDFRSANEDAGKSDIANLVMTLPSTRARQLDSKKLKALAQTWKQATTPGISADAPSNGVLDALLDRNPGLFADLRRLPVNAVAFYWPFHLEPLGRWGIYIFVDRLVEYSNGVKFAAPFFQEKSVSVLLHLVLFEIFHHEFYHHLVECAATTIEILADALGADIPGYIAYRRKVWEKAFKQHAHDPLEEALANAYAYHALGFISRVKVGYKDALVGSYQRNLSRFWLKEAAGYRSAGHYLSGAQIVGNSVLLAMILGRKPHPGLLQVAQSVMPSGYTAYVPKPDIPTYLVGSPEVLDLFHQLVPAPNETYCHLFWPFDTAPVERLLNARYQQIQAEKAAAKAARDKSRP